LDGTGIRERLSGAQGEEPMRTVLLVDEDHYVSEALALFLEGKYRPLIASDTQGVRRVLAECTPDLTILDPAGTVASALEVLRSECPEVPIILTGTSLGELQSESRRHPGRFVGVLLKPFDNDKMLGIVTRLMNLAGVDTPAAGD
jgi:DNA-binding NtrC family response regulator